MTAPAHCNEGLRPTQLPRNDAWSSGKSKRFGLCNIRNTRGFEMSYWKLWIIVRQVLILVWKDYWNIHLNEDIVGCEI